MSKATTPLVLTLALLAPPLSSGAQAQPERGPPLYLALGNSLAIGVQPDARGEERPTSEGYADQLATMLRRALPALELVKLGCAGETTTSMSEGGECTYRRGDQLREAVALIEAERDRLALITLDIGANDLTPCIRGDGIDDACVGEAIVRIASGLPEILRALREAAGPDVDLVGMTYPNVFAAAWLGGPEGERVAVRAAKITSELNEVIRATLRQHDALVAEVGRAFRNDDFRPGATSDVPRSVARVCHWTWMCAEAPQGPNTHANRQGYRAMARAFLAALPHLQLAQAALP